MRRKRDPFAETDIFLILIEPKRGEHYAPDTEWPVLTSRHRTMLAALGETDKCRVLHCPAIGTREDISEDIARDALKEFRRERRVFKHDLSDVPEFITYYLTNDEICALSFVETAA